MLLRRASGFTLMELMMVLAIMAIVMGIAIPSIRSYTNNARIGSAVNDLILDFALARTEAARQGYVTTVCRSSNQTACETSGDNWAVGRIVFIDKDSDGVVDTGEDIVRKTAAAATTLTIAGSTTSLNRLSFAPSGARTRGSADAYFTVCASGLTERRVTVSAAGRTRATRGTSTCS